MALIAGNLLTLNEQDIETDGTGYGSTVNCTTAQTSAQAFSGTFSLSMTSVAAGDMSCNTQSFCPVAQGSTIILGGQLRAATVARTSCILFVNYYSDNVGTFVSNDFAVGHADSTSAWTAFASSPRLVPSGTGIRFARMGFLVQATAAGGEVHYLDFMSLIGPLNVAPQLQIPPGFRAPMSFAHSLRQFPAVYTTWQVAAACTPRAGLVPAAVRALQSGAASGNRAGMAIQSPSVTITWLPAGDVAARAGLASVPPLMIRPSFSAVGGLARTVPAPVTKRATMAVAAGGLGRAVPAAVAVRRPTVSVGGLGRTSPGLGFLRQSSATLRALGRAVPNAAGVRTVQPVSIGGRTSLASNGLRAPQLAAAVRARGAVTTTPAPARQMTASVSGLARAVTSFVRGSQPSATLLARTGGLAAGVAVRQTAGTGSGRARTTGVTLAVRQLGAATGGQGRLPSTLGKLASVAANIGGLARTVLVALRAPQPAAATGGRARLPALTSRLTFAAATLASRGGTSTTPVGVRPTAAVLLGHGGLGATTLRQVPTAASVAARARFAASFGRALAAGAGRFGATGHVEAHPTAGPPPAGPTFEPTAVRLTLTETGVRPLPPRHR